MQYVQRNILGVVTTLSILFVMANSWSMPITKHNLESIKTMSYGILKAKDNFGAPIQLVWEEVDVTTKRLNDVFRQASQIFAQTYATMELEFARKHPEAVESEMFLKPLVSFFKDGVEHVNWEQVEKTLHAQLVQFFSETDFAKYLAPDERQWFVTAKDADTGQTLGIIQFLVQPLFESGTVKVAMFGVEQGAHERGIDKLLLSAIFKLPFSVSRIFLHTRVTNVALLCALQELDFTPFVGPLPYWQDMEYLCERSEQLQNIAKSIEG
ncbi:MAG: hypothetical protein AB7F19_02275 [Candidatus Babeliales bacterium]